MAMTVPSRWIMCAWPENVCYTSICWYRYMLHKFLYLCMRSSYPWLHMCNSFHQSMWN